MIVSLSGLSLDLELNDALRELCASDNVTDIRSYLRSEAVHHVVSYLQENGCGVREVKDTNGDNSWKEEDLPWGRR